MGRKKSITFSSRPAGRSQVDDLDIDKGHDDGTHALLAAPTANRAACETERGVPQGYLGKAFYGVVYGISYGVVFGVLVVGAVIPGSKVIANATTDAAAAAKRRFDKLSRNPDDGQSRIADNSGEPIEFAVSNG